MDDLWRSNHVYCILDAGIQTPALNGKREVVAPRGNLLLEVVNLLDLAAGDASLEVLELVGLLGEGSLLLLTDLDGLIDVLADTLELLLSETTRSHGGGTNTDTARGESRLVTGDGVLVASNVDLLKDGLNTGTIQAVLAKVDEDHVAVSAVRHELVAESLESVLQGLGVGNNLLLVGLEVRAGSLLQGNSQSSDGVVMRTTLVAGEDGEVDGVLEVVEGLLAGLGIDGADALAEEDHGTTGTTERLVGGGCNNVGVLEGSGDDLGSNETGDVSHIDNKVGTDGVGDLAHALVVNETAVSRGTSNKDLRAEENGVLLECIIVNDAGVEVDTVRHGLKVSRDSRDLLLGGLVTVAQMATMGKVETHETAVDRHDSLVDLEVGRGSRKALDVDTPLLGVEVESLKSTLLAETLDLVDVLVATIVTSTGVTLRVLVGHGGTKGIEDSAGGDVLGGDEDNGLALTLNLILLQRA
jgi:hypothetical protein